MKRDNVNYLLVGTFVLIMLTLLMVALYLITGRSGPTDEYHVNYRNVTGLKFGTPVFYEGYQIGQVDSITPARHGGKLHYRVDISIRQGWQIPEDSVARMLASGLLSAITINIREGSSASLLKPGAEIAGQEGADVFTVINEVALDLNQLADTSLRPLLDNLNHTLGTVSTQLESSGPELVEQVKMLVERLNDSAQGLQALLKEQNRRDIESVIGNLKTTSVNAVQVSQTAIKASDYAEAAARNVSQLSADFKRTRSKLDGLIREMGSMVTQSRPDMEKSLRDVRKTLDIVAQHVEAVAYHMEGTSRNMHEFSRQIRQNPGLLLGTKPPDDKQAGGQ